MARLTFSGGVHPFDGKSLSKEKTITKFLPTGEMVYPLSQHIGAPAKPVVKKGDRVLVGQMIAEAGGFVSAPIYATVAGTVKAIEERRVPVGDMVTSIIVENDGSYEEVEFPKRKPIEEQSKEEIIKEIQEAGIVGMGGAGFPTHVKLSPKSPDDIHYVIVNGAECEPYLTSDYRRMMENPEWVLEGLKIVLKLFDHATGIIAIEDNKKDCIKALKKLTVSEPGITVLPLKTKYPQGSERQIIYACTGKAINSGMLPADAGAIVDNVDTIVAIYHAVTNGRPLMNRIVTVTGDAIKKPQNFLVPIGTSYQELIPAAGGFVTEPEKIISGGPMMGFSLFNTNVPITKTSSALLCFAKDEVKRAKQTACIRCGKCVEVCPSRIMPNQLNKMALKGDKEGFEKRNGMECVECGSCSFICPARKNLTQNIKTMRKQILADRRKK